MDPLLCDMCGKACNGGELSFHEESGMYLCEYCALEECEVIHVDFVARKRIA